MSRLKIGIDVGGTNTDAVVVDEDGQVVASTKSATTLDPSDGIAKALSEVIAGVDKTKITQAMLGTTHPANAIIQRRNFLDGVHGAAAAASATQAAAAERSRRERYAPCRRCSLGSAARKQWQLQHHAAPRQSRQ
jgi:N-methylhydantoinase A/oxoprolinase/acetone carboxylase beta subunit